MAPNGNSDDTLREGAVLFADVSGSTALYQQIGDREAFAAIQAYLATLRTIVLRCNGVFVKSSGDDVLCWFPRPPDAVSAARQMLQLTSDRGLDVHAGLEWGSFVCVTNDIFGDCVNAAARMCDLANRKELLIGETCFDQLDDATKADFVAISPMRLKGRSEASRIYSLQIDETGERTQFANLDRGYTTTFDAVFEYEGRQWHITEGDVLTVGRYPENAVQVPVQSVSRKHATMRLTNGLVEFEDHSSTGSAVQKESGEVLAVARRTVVLSGVGTVYLGAKHAADDAPRLFYEVLLR